MFKGNNSKYLSEKYVSNIKSNIVIITIYYTHIYNITNIKREYYI